VVAGRGGSSSRGQLDELRRQQSGPAPSFVTLAIELEVPEGDAVKPQHLLH